MMWGKWEWGWGDGLVVRVLAALPEDHGGSRLCVTPVPGYQGDQEGLQGVPSSSLQGYQVHTWYADTCRKNTHNHKMLKIKGF